jgi:ubiquitin C-terminal hydrolase
LNNLWLNCNIGYYSPDAFKNIISQMNPLFAGIQANDSKDLILFLMETMHSELNTAQKINISNQNQVNQYDYQTMLKIFANYYLNNYNSIISNLFYGSYNSMMKCLKCNVIAHNIQCFNILIFPLEEVRKFKNKKNEVNIIDCFEYYQKEELITGANQIYCNRCNTMANSLNSSKLITGPKVLVIILNRGIGMQYNVKLKFEDYIDIKKFINSKESPIFYELIGVVAHFGPSSMSGCFIAFCKSFVDNKWYKYNDVQVNPTSFREVCNAGVPHILFYSYIKT